MLYATVYRYNRIALDTNTMGNSIDVEKNISSVVPTQGALVRANFDTRIGVRALDFGPIDELRKKHGDLAAVAPWYLGGGVDNQTIAVHTSKADMCFSRALLRLR